MQPVTRQPNFWLKSQEYQTNHGSKILTFSKNIRGLKGDPIWAGADVIKCKCAASSERQKDAVLGQKNEMNEESF